MPTSEPHILAAGLVPFREQSCLRDESQCLASLTSISSADYSPDRRNSGAIRVCSNICRSRAKPQRAELVGIGAYTSTRSHPIATNGGIFRWCGSHLFRLTDGTGICGHSSGRSTIDRYRQVAGVGAGIRRLLKKDEVTHIDTLVERLEPELSSSEIFAALFELELNGKIRQLPGKNFVKSF
jgi:DprA/Smf-like nucleotide binding protein involved in DNA uptake